MGLGALLPRGSGIALLVALFAALVATLTGGFVLLDRNNEIQRKKIQLQPISLLVLEHAERVVENAEKLISFLETELTATATPDRQKLFDLMQRFLPGDRTLSSAWITGRDGNVLVESWGLVPRSANAATRPYFQTRLQGASGLRIDQAEVGSVTGKPRFTVSKDIREADGALKWIVVVGVYSGHFDNLYQHLALSRGGMRAGLYIVDNGRGHTIARVSPEETPQSYVDKIVELSRDSEARLETVDDRDGARLATVRRSANYPQLMASASISVTDALALWRQTALALAVLSAAIVLVFGGLVWFWFRYSQSRLENENHALILREVHHRVKNNFQALSSLLQLRLARAANPEVKNTLDSLQTSLMAFGRAFELLEISSHHNQLNACTLLHHLTVSVATASGLPIAFRHSGEAEMQASSALNLAIVINELLANAIKHARAAIHVNCECARSQICVTVCNDMKEGQQPDRQGFGQKMIERLVAQEKGSMTVGMQAGEYRVEVCLPLDPRLRAAYSTSPARYPAGATAATLD